MSVSRRQSIIFNWFPAPQFLSLATAGICVTDEDVRFVELRRNIFGGKLHLAHLSVDKSSDHTSVLKDLASRYSIRFANATLPDEKSYLFIASIDKVSADGLYDAVAFIIEENVPIALAESVFSYEIIEEDEEAGKIKLAVTVVPKAVVEAQTKLFESAGITVVSFDIESQAIARAIVPVGDKRTRLILNLAEKKTGFYIVENGVVQFSTTLNNYADNKDSAQPGINANNIRQASEIKDKMDEVVSFWINSGEGRKVEAVLLCGFWSGKSEFIEIIVGKSNIELEQANVWSNTAFLGDQAAAVPAAESVDCAAAIGASLPH